MPHVFQGSTVYADKSGHRHVVINVKMSRQRGTLEQLEKNNIPTQKRQVNSRLFFKSQNWRPEEGGILFKV